MTASRGRRAAPASRPAWLLGLGFASFLLATAPSCRKTAAPPPPPDPAVAVFEGQLGSRFYGLYRGDHKVGWLRSTFRRDTFRGEPTLVAEGHAEVVVKGGAAIHRTVLETRHVFAGAPPHDLLRYRTSTTRDGLTEWRELRAGPTGWVAASARGKEPEEVRGADIGEYTLGGFLALERWVADGPALGDSRAIQRLDTTSLRVTAGEAQVTGVTHTVIDAVPGTVYSVATFDGGGESTTRYDGDGRILAVEGGDVDLRAESEDEAKALDAPRDLFLDALITPSGLPLRSPENLARITYGIPAAAAPLIPEASGQRVVPRGEGFALEVVRGGHAREATEAEQTEALREDAAHPRTAPRVGRLLGQAVPPRTNQRDTVRLLAQYVRDYLTDDRSAEPLDLRGEPGELLVLYGFARYCPRSGCGGHALNQPRGHSRGDHTQDDEASDHQRRCSPATQYGDGIEVAITDGGDGDHGPPQGVAHRGDVRVRGALFEAEDAQCRGVDEYDGGCHDVGHDAGPDGGARCPVHDLTQREWPQEP